MGHESKLLQDINGTAACALNTVGIQCSHTSQKLQHTVHATLTHINRKSRLLRSKF